MADTFPPANGPRSPTAQSARNNQPTGGNLPRNSGRPKSPENRKSVQPPTDLDLPHGSSLAVLEADPDRRIGTPQMGSHLGHGVMFQIAPPQAEFGTISNIRYSLALI